MLKTSWTTPLTSVDTVAKEVLGSLRFENNKWYKYVQLSNATATVALVAGDAVGYRADKFDVNIVVSDMTDADTVPIPAGIAVGAVAGVLAVTYYIWIQVKGRCTLSTTVAGSGAAGEPFRLSTTDKTFTRAIEADTAGVYKMVAGILQNATNKTAYLDCPL